MTGLTRAESRDYALTVLLMPGWPRGWCPVHVFEQGTQCGPSCWRARVAFAQAARELDDYFHEKAVHIEYERRYGDVA